MRLHHLTAAALVISLAISGWTLPSRQAGSDQQIAKRAIASVGDAQNAPQAFGKPAKPATEKVKRKPVWPWIVGGILAVGAVTVYLLLKGGGGRKSPNANPSGSTVGSAQIISTPDGARVYLDGADTGKTTNCVLTGLEPGPHTVKLTKEGYADAEAAFEVTANVQSGVSVELKPYLVIVSLPEQGDSYAWNETIAIRWNTQAPAAPPQPGAPDPKRLLDINGVKIELYQGGNQAVTLAENTPNDGEFEWKIPTATPPHHSSAIRVSCATDPSVSGQSGTFALSATKLVRLEYAGRREFDAYGSRLNLFPVRCAYGGRIESVRYSVQLIEWQNTVDITAYLEGANKSQITIFNRDKSQWYWKVLNSMDSDHLLDLNGATTAFNGSEAKGDWTLQIWVHDAYCGDRGGCGGVRHFWVEVEISLTP